MEPFTPDLTGAEHAFFCLRLRLLLGHRNECLFITNLFITPECRTTATLTGWSEVTGIEGQSHDDRLR
jgi:hypothetical protein